MTRGAYLLGLALFGVCLIGGVALTAPSPSELGWVERASCAEWLAAPREGAFTLEDCELDLSAAERRGTEIDVPVLAPGTAQIGVEGDPRVYWRTDDRRLIAIHERVANESGLTRQRTLERFEDLFIQRRAITGVVTDGDGEHVIESAARSRVLRGLGLSLGLLGLFGLLGFVALQRRWLRRAAALGAGDGQPLSF